MCRLNFLSHCDGGTEAGKITPMTTRIITHGDLTWLDLAHPSQADVDALRERFPYFHPLNPEDIRSPIERPKLDQDDDYIFAVMHFPLWDSRHELSRAAEVDFFVGRDYVVTVHNGALKPLANLVERCQSYEAEPARLLGRGANQAFHTIIDGLVEHYGFERGAPDLLFWELHASESEEGHGDIGGVVVSRYANDAHTQESVLDAVVTSIDLQWLAFDGMHRAFFLEDPAYERWR